MPVSYSQGKRKRNANFSELNRHMVMHGDSVDYGTKKNSLKAISLLYYVAKALEYTESISEDNVAPT